MLRHYVGPSQDDWDLKLPCAEYAVNNSVKPATGASPFYLNYGRHPRGPASVAIATRVPAANEFVENLNVSLSRAKDCLVSAQSRMKKIADKHRRELQFNAGDDVLLSTKNLRVKGARKFLPRYLGPVQVIRRIGKVAYELELPANLARLHPVFHVSLLQPYVAGSMPNTLPVWVIEDEPEYEVDRILDHRDCKVSQKSRKTKREFLVKWRNCPDGNTWEPESNCRHCEDRIQEYYKTLMHID